MDIVTDLTAQAVSYLTTLQDFAKSNLDPAVKKKMKGTFLWEEVDKLEKITGKATPRLRQAISDISWCSASMKESDDLVSTFFELIKKLLAWLSEYHVRPQQNNNEFTIEGGTLYSSPYQWRVIIRAILYDKPGQRLQLARILHYMPVQLIFCVGGKELSGYSQRLYQVWDPKAEYSLWQDSDRKKNQKWWNEIFVPQPGDQLINSDKSFSKEGIFTGIFQFFARSPKPVATTRRQQAEALLTNDCLLLSRLMNEGIALPFESLFNNELDEICRSRNLRKEDSFTGTGSIHPSAVLGPSASKDPLQRAKEMKLSALALSGGGIRSATFCLGVIQKLAEQNKLSGFDYLSTVSGGGYIGTWLASWIKRDGSLSKVTNRLDTKQSPDPLGEEVRPVRWLRMFSNYLAPDASLMSADSWTMGVTWFRNTLLNQIILLLLLCTGLSAVNTLYHCWSYLTQADHHFLFQNVLLWSLLIFLPGVLMAGYGMQAFDREYPDKSLLKYSENRYLSLCLVGWAIITSFAVSALLSGKKCELFDAYADKVRLLFPAGAVAFAAMVLIAYIGYYRRYPQGPNQRRWIDLAIIGSSFLGALTGLAGLAGIWSLFQYIGNDLRFITKDQSDYAGRWIFILGTPLILESIACCVVIRMAVMGDLFPDERREWWGRMGAITHRFILLWMLITMGALILPGLFTYCREQMNLKHLLFINIPALFGGWAVIIGFAVKLAYQSKTGIKKSGGTGAMATEAFVRVAPYLFIIGFLLIGAYTLQNIMSWANLIPSKYIFNWLVTCLEATLLLAALTVFFSWRVGVNEFSLHHFYRNRLVRAYLGATRKRIDRDRTSNAFTGFDKNDDIHLATFLSIDKDKPYGGPYPLINTTLNATVVSELDRQDRKAESFIFTPLFCGFDFSPTRSAAYAKDQVYEYGYRPTLNYAYANGPMIGTAMAISGAAVSPNMGYHSSPLTAFLLTMFNVRLGWWIGNTRLDTWKNSDPTFGLTYLVSDLIGNSDIDSEYVCLSDGGHFDNMGLYELIRRRVNHIILCDAEEDDDLSCEGLANAIRRCRIDFGAEIVIGTAPVTEKNPKTGNCKAHYVSSGTIKYPGESVPSGTLIYIKTTIVGDEPVDVKEYNSANPAFPQQSTSDQFFTEEQFESYRQLGYHSIS